MLAPTALLPLIISFFFKGPPTPAISTLSLHDALPISAPHRPAAGIGDGPGERRRGRPRPARPARLAADGRARLHKVQDRKSTRLNSSHLGISYAVFCLKKKKNIQNRTTAQRNHSQRRK